MFLGRNAVMRKALGATPEDECRLGVHKAANVSLRADISPFLEQPFSAASPCVCDQTY